MSLTKALPVSVALIFLSAAARGQSPAQPSDTQVLQALLGEVRQLRISLERATIVSTRMQMALQRMRLQEERVTRVSQQLEETRKTIGEFESEKPRIAERIKDVEEHARQTADPMARGQMEADYKGMKTHLEQVNVLQEQRRAREGELASQLLAEQAKLNELNDRLNQMERALEPQ